MLYSPFLSSSGPNVSVVILVAGSGSGTMSCQHLESLTEGYDAHDDDFFFSTVGSTWIFLLVSLGSSFVGLQVNVDHNLLHLAPFLCFRWYFFVLFATTMLSFGHLHICIF